SVRLSSISRPIERRSASKRASASIVAKTSRQRLTFSRYRLRSSPVKTRAATSSPTGRSLPGCADAYNPAYRGRRPAEHAVEARGQVAVAGIADRAGDVGEVLVAVREALHRGAEAQLRAVLVQRVAGVAPERAGQVVGRDVDRATELGEREALGVA